MKVLHVIPSLSPKDGGPSFAMPLIARGLKRAGIEVVVATTENRREQHAAYDGMSVVSFPRQTEFYKVSFPLSRWLSRHISDFDLVHIHALFSYTCYSAARFAMKRRVPYIVRPLGVLNRWGMENRRPLMKRLSFRFIEGRILQNAAAIHYTSQQEKIEAEESGAGTSSAVIPLGLDLSTFREMPDAARFYDQFPSAPDRKIILFLSRLDPKKGLNLLLRAFARVHRDDPKTLLVIAGDGDDQFVAGLRELAKELAVEKEVLWTGFVDGIDKRAAMSAASVFVLPSYSENFGVAAVEAMAAGLPCVLSEQVAIARDAFEYEAGLVVPCDVEKLAVAIRTLIDDSALQERLGTNARRLAGDRFSLEVMTDSLVRVYDRILSQGAAQSLDSVALLGGSGIHVK